MQQAQIRVRISAGRALKERQCTLKGQVRYVNVRGSVHWKGVYQVHKFTHRGKFMHLIPKMYHLFAFKEKRVHD